MRFNFWIELVGEGKSSKNRFRGFLFWQAVRATTFFMGGACTVLW